MDYSISMSVYGFEHHLQSEIFARLRTAKSLRYSELRDPAMESSLFMYHLNELIRQKLVEKVGRGEYALAPAGVMLAQTFSGETGKPRQGVLGYTLLFMRSDRGKWFVLERTKHPYVGMYACISGKLHMNETLSEAVQRELADFTNGQLSNVTPDYRGYASVMIQKGEQLTHIAGPVWFADNVPEIELQPVRHGNAHWMDWEQQPYERFIPGWKEIVQMIEQGKPSHLDLAFVLEQSDDRL